MSGHSKWATTKRAKAITDAKRASIFTKLTKAIAIAAREGADQTHNFKLRIAVDKARAASVPKDNIDRAIKRGSGTGDDTVTLEEITYEGFGPHGAAFIIHAVTDNKNRASSEIRHLFSAHNGTLGASNSVAWMFDHVGHIIVPTPEDRPHDEVELAVIDAGAQNLNWLDDNTVVVITAPTELQKVKEKIEAAGLTVSDAGLGFEAKETLTPTAEQRPALESFYEALEDAEDVQDYWSNMAV